jgi:hypothetical protein
VREDLKSLDVNPIVHEIQCGRNQRTREPKAGDRFNRLRGEG